MAKPLKFDLDFYSGDSEVFVLRWKNPNGTPVPNLGTAQATMNLSYSISEGVVLSVSGVVDETTGEVSFSFSEEDTELLIGTGELQRKKYQYDVQFNFPTETKTLLRGVLTVHREVEQEE